MLLAWSSAVVYLAIVVLTSVILRRPQANPCFSKRLKMSPSPNSRARTYFSKPLMYGTSGGRGPVLNCGPRVDRYLMFMTGVSMRRPTAE